MSTSLSSSTLLPTTVHGHKLVAEPADKAGPVLAVAAAVAATPTSLLLIISTIITGQAAATIAVRVFGVVRLAAAGAVHRAGPLLVGVKIKVKGVMRRRVMRRRVRVMVMVVPTPH